MRLSYLCDISGIYRRREVPTTEIVYLDGISHIDMKL